MKPFSNLAKIVYKRTYARRKSDGTTENWNDTVDRVVAGNVRGHNVPEKEVKQLLRFMKERKAGPAGRGYWFSGTKAHEQIGGVALNNCWALTGDRWENFVTAQDLLMLGGGVGLSVEHRYVSNLPKVKRGVTVTHKAANDADFIVPDSREGWCALTYRVLESFFVTGKSFTFSTVCVRGYGERIEGFGGTACLTGDTVLYKDRKKSSKQNSVTIKELFDMQQERNGYTFGQVKLRCLDEENKFFYRNRVLGVTYSGVAPVFRLTTKGGYSIRATGNHRFMVEDGTYKTVAEFAPGEQIAVNGRELPIGQCAVCPAPVKLGSMMCRLHRYKAYSCGKENCTNSVSRRNALCKVCREYPNNCPDCSTKVSRRATRCKDCADKAQVQTVVNGTTARMRQECLEARKSFCQLCSTTEGPFEVHHIDKDPLNNYWGNLLNLCQGCHHSVHAVENKFGNAYGHKYLSFDTIVSIEPAGEEDVYDVEMQAPDHNFVANGFVSHNSGPIPLIRFVDNLCKILSKREGKAVRPIDALDLICATGEMVVAGNVRRSAIIILGDCWDKEYLKAKRWDLGEVPSYRACANLSVVGDDVEDFHPLFWKTYEAGEPFGIVNRKNIQKYGRMGELKRDSAYLCNPCAEATLETHEPCNLQNIPLMNLDSEEEFEEAGVLMHRYGKRVTLEKFHIPEAQAVIDRNRRIGTSITGCLGSPLFNPSTLDRVYNAIQRENVSYSAELGIPESIRTTTLNPGGTVSKMHDQDGCEGIHAAYSRYIIQRIRFASDDKLIPVLRAAGHHIEPVVKFDGSIDPQTLVVDFYVKAPDGMPVADEDWDTWKQLDVLKMAQKYWADQSCSVTVYYRREELEQLKVWLGSNLQYLKTISFLCHSEHGFKQAPKEAISEEQYYKMSKKIKNIDFNEIGEGELESMECEGGACPIK